MVLNCLLAKMDFWKICELQALLHTDRDHLNIALDTSHEYDNNCAVDDILSTKEAVNSVLNLILTAQFEKIFENDEVSRLFSSVRREGSWHVCLVETIQCYFNDSISPEDRQNRKIIVLFIGVAALQFFVQQNWTGPLAKEHSSPILPCSNESKSAIDLLLFCNQQVYPLVKYPEFLLLAKVILNDISNETETSSWWKLRYLGIHQAVLEEKNSEIYSRVVNAINEAIDAPISTLKSLTTQLKVECSLLSLCFHDVSKGKQYLQSAQEDSGLCMKLAGALGTRTRFQTIPHAQLYLQVDKGKSGIASLYPDNPCIPVDVKLENETLLNDTKFLETGPSSCVPELNVEDKTVILAFSVLHQKQNAHDELLEEEVTAYTNFILSGSSNFCIQYCALLMRSELEKQKSRKVERAMMQLQTLLDLTRNSTDSEPNRLQLFYSTPMPPTWEVEKKLAKILLSLGSVKSALDIFLRLEMWEECVFCYRSLQRDDKALKIIEGQLEKGKTPLLLCLKGDVTNEPLWYEEAWEISKHHSARAKRSLGYYYFQKKEYSECIPHLLESVEIDGLEERVWFFLGHAATQIENYTLAAKCYRNLVNLNSESFEAWNNLSNAYIKLNDKLRAWKTLQEAIKCNYEEWKVWENYLLVSVDVGAFEEAISAWHRLIDLKGKHIDDEVLHILEKAIIQNLKDINDQPTSRLLEKSLQLIGHITSTDTSSFKTWTSYANLLDYKATKLEDPLLLDRVIQYYHKSLSIIKNEIQKKNLALLLVNYRAMLDCACALSKVYIRCYMPSMGDAHAQQQLHSAKLMIRNTITFAKQKAEHFSEAEIQDELIQSRLHQLDSDLERIVKALS